MAASKVSFAGASWIWAPNYDDSAERARFVLFRKTFTVDGKHALSTLKPFVTYVSADTRYRLFVNGRRASFGPCKSYPNRWYYEEVDIAPYLVAGTNVISAKVLRLSAAHVGSTAITASPIPGFFLYGQQNDIILHTGLSWRTWQDRSVTVISRAEWKAAMGPPFLCLNEHVDNALAVKNWMQPSMDDACWPSAVVYSFRSEMMPILEPRKLFPRPIPHLPEIEKRFQNVVTTAGPVPALAWGALIAADAPVIIPAETCTKVELGVDVLTTGFLQLHACGGGGAKLRILCAESYERPWTAPSWAPGRVVRHKEDRTDHIRGVLYGFTDELLLSDGQNDYEPFWFRTFRYVQLHIETGPAPVTIQAFTFRETNYPLDVETSVQLPPELDCMWRISLNTLKNCMHETYEDCPFYEQNQFSMDARLQMLFTYQLSRDDRLARKCMNEFHASRHDDGLLDTVFPTSYRIVNIPQFSLHWILMVYDHMLYFGDMALVKRFFGTVDGILDHFHSRLTAKGMVGRFDDEAWPFVDWVQEWRASRGVPPAYNMGDGELAYNSLVYAYVLQKAAELCEFVGRHDTASEYRARAASCNRVVNERCFDGTAYVDSPDTADKSQHTQVFAIMAGAIAGDAAKALMRWTLNTEGVPRCSYAMGFYLLRAAAAAGVYDESFDGMLQPWRSMIANNLTTWAEDDVMFRSDCHGWSSSPIYEVVAELFGVRPTGPGYGGVTILPRYSLLPPKASCRVTVPGGGIEASWTVGEGLTLRSTRAIRATVMSTSGLVSVQALVPNTAYYY